MDEATKYLSELKQALNYRKAGEFRRAAQIYTSILNRQPDHYEASYSLGMLCHQGGRNDLAIPLVKKSVDIRPDIFAGVINLGVIQREEGMLDDSRASLEAAVALEPDSVIAHATLGLVLIDQGDLDGALAELKRALELEPDNPMTLARLGMLHQVRNEADTAAGYFCKVIELRPEDVNAHRSLALVRKQTEYSDNIRWMEKTFSSQSRSAGDRVLMGFALGKSFDDLGEYEKAFSCWYKGHTLRAASDYSHEGQEAVFQRHRQAFDRSFLDHCSSAAIDDATPVFVLGMPRSGTTLTEQILASHPSVYGAGEVEYLRLFADTVEGETGKPFPQGIATVAPRSLRNTGLAYIEKLKRNAGGAERVVDKVPLNFMRVGLIAAIMPRAKIILCERDALDNCLSIYQNIYTPAHPYSADLTALGQYYRLYRELIDWWEEILPGHMLRVRYEQLVSDTETQVRRMLDHCGLVFHENCLAFHETRRQVKTPSEAQVRQPIYRHSMGRWKNYERHLGPLIEALGRYS